MKFDVCVCAYNEEQNIEDNLNSILIQQLDKDIVMVNVYVVSDGSTDKTEEIVKRISKKDKRVKLLVHSTRQGKAAAINTFLDNSISDFVILDSGDNQPEIRAFNYLMRNFDNKEVGVVGGRIVPVNVKNNFMGFLAHYMYELHHEAALIKPKFGELIAFRRVFKRMPLTAVDEECIAMLLKHQWYKGKYEPRAIVFNKAVTNMDDYVKQRRRIYAGHLSLREHHRYFASTIGNVNMLRLVLGNFVRKPKNIVYVFSSIILELYTRFIGWFDFYVKGKKHYIWEIAKSTKRL